MDLLSQALNQLAPKEVGIEEFTESSEYCGRNLYPGQRVLLKTMFLEELTGEEEDILSYWINGGSNGTDFVISPNIRERVEWLREAGYPHFREIALVGGRRSSKGFCTGVAMAKVMWSTLQLQDPGIHYGIDPEKEIYFSCIAGSQEQAQGRQYADFSSTIETCKVFDPYIIKSLETEIRVATNSDLRRIAQEKNRGNRIQKDIARLRGNAMAANAGTIRGLAMMAYAQPLDAKILTSTGWTTMGQLQVGQRIIGSDGNSQEILKIHRRGLQRAFRVSFSDGSSTVCSADHLWTLNNRGGQTVTRSLSELIKDMKATDDQWRLPTFRLMGGEYKLPYDLSPYLLGAMLGDGGMTTRGATFCNDDLSIVAAVQSVLPVNHQIKHRTGIIYGIVNTRTKENLVIRGLKEVGVWGHRGPEKFIPKQCFEMSLEDRYALLQGLLDTDGSVNGSSIRFGSASRKLANDVIDLVRSLGGYATLYISDRPGHRLEGRTLPPQKSFCEVCISGLSAKTLFRSQEKLSRCTPYARYKFRHRRLIDVTELNDVRMQCITVSNDDGLYITDDFIVTHNCIDEIAFMLPGESKSSPNKIYEAANPSLGQFGVDGLAFLNSSPYTKIGLFYEKYVEGLIEFDPTRPVDEPAPLLDDGLDLRNRNGEPRLMVIQFPSWGLYEGYQKAKNRAKLKGVLMASPEWDPEEKDANGEDLWTAKDKQLIRTARAEEQANPEGFKVEYRGKFAEVMDAYMEPRRIDEMFAGIPSEWVYDQNSENPEVPRLVVKPFRSNTGKDATNLFKYKFHLDPSSTTAGFGFAIAHTEMIPDWRDIQEEHVVFDLIKRWQPQKFPGKVIRWPTILEEIMKYAEYFFPFEITFDQHESAQPVQELTEKLNDRNIPTRVYIKPATAELNWHRWEVCKTSIYAKLVHAPSDTEDTRWCSQELKFLQIQGGTSKFPRVDRQEIGPVQTKDMADCVAECVNTLIGNQISNRTRERLSSSAVMGSAEGGYGIGFSGTSLRPGGAPPNLATYEFDKMRKAQLEYQSPTRGALGRSRGGRQSNKARW